MKQTILLFLSALGFMVSCQPAPTLTSTMPAPTNTIALPTLSPPKVSPLVFVAKMTGDANDPMWAPMAFAFDKQGNIYVADAANSRILKFDPNGKTLDKWGSSGSGEGQFSFQHIPGGIAVDDQGNVFVIDDGNARIEKFDGNGKFLTQWGSKGTGDGQFTTPQNLIVDSQGSVYVLDFSIANVQKFDGNGKFLSKLGGFGSENGQFRTPHGLALDGQGSIYVGDALGFYQKLDRNGKFLTKFAVPNCPWIDGLTVDAQGNVYAFQLTGAEIKQPSICKFDSTGKTLGIWQNFGSDDGQWKALYGIHVDAQGQIYILDRGNNRIQKLQQP